MTDDPDFAADEEILKGAEERAGKASPGPWEVRTHDGLYAICWPHGWVMEGEGDKVNAPFIAAARSDIPVLAAIARKYQRALAQAFDALEWELVNDCGCHCCKQRIERARANVAEVRRILEGGE